MSVFQRIQNIDRRIIYTLVFVFLLFPMFRPLGLPLNITRETQASFDAIDELPAGSLMLFVTAIGPGNEAELLPQSIAVIKHMISLGHKIVFVPLAAVSPAYTARYAELCAGEGLVAGVDYLDLPFLAGGETVYAAIGSNFQSLYENEPASPLLGSIADVTDFAMVIDCGAGESQRWAIAHIEEPKGVPIVALITAVILAVTQPYFSSGQVQGLVSGLNGAAEYEFLAKVPGKAAAGMDAQSLGHLLIILFVILGNVGYFAGRRPGRSAGGNQGGAA